MSEGQFIGSIQGTNDGPNIVRFRFEFTICIVKLQEEAAVVLFGRTCVPISARILRMDPRDHKIDLA